MWHRKIKLNFDFSSQEHFLLPLQCPSFFLHYWQPVRMFKINLPHFLSFYFLLAEVATFSFVFCIQHNSSQLGCLLAFSWALTLHSTSSWGENLLETDLCFLVQGRQQHPLSSSINSNLYLLMLVLERSLQEIQYDHQCWEFMDIYHLIPLLIQRCQKLQYLLLFPP